MDEAERCHALVILDEGRVVASGPPAELSRDIGVQVVLVRSPQPRRVGRTLRQQPWVRSVAQIGNELRVLTLPDQREVEQAVRQAIGAAGLELDSCHTTGANLEDVFVAATLAPQEAA